MTTTLQTFSVVRFCRQWHTLPIKTDLQRMLVAYSAHNSLEIIVFSQNLVVVLYFLGKHFTLLVYWFLENTTMKRQLFLLPCFSPFLAKRHVVPVTSSSILRHFCRLA